MTRIVFDDWWVIAQTTKYGYILLCPWNVIIYENDEGELDHLTCRGGGKCHENVPDKVLTTWKMLI